MLLEIQLGGLQIRLTHILHLLLEDLRIFLLGVEPILAAVGLLGRLRQIAADLADRNGGHDGAA
jgi:hypothetical protein